MQNIFWAGIIAISVTACSSDEAPVDCEKSGLIINVAQIVNASNCNASDGSIQVAVTGGEEPYSFLLNDQLIDPNEQIENLPAGSYSILVRDANNCERSANNVSILAEDFSFTSSLQPNTSCLSGNGSVSIDVTGNNPPYLYKLGNGTFTSDNSFSGLTSGNHTVTVSDNNNCVVILTITVPQGATGTSWTNDVKPIMEMSCAISGCHNGVSRSNDFREYASVKSFANSIKSKTQDRSMPFDGTLTQNQIDIIACWVDDGALMN